MEVYDISTKVQYSGIGILSSLLDRFGFDYIIIDNSTMGCSEAEICAKGSERRGIALKILDNLDLMAWCTPDLNGKWNRLSAGKS